MEREKSQKFESKQALKKFQTSRKKTCYKRCEFHTDFQSLKIKFA